MAEYDVREVSEHRHEHYAVTEDGRPLAYTNNAADARLIMFALAIADTAVKNDER